MLGAFSASGGALETAPEGPSTPVASSGTSAIGCGVRSCATCLVGRRGQRLVWLVVQKCSELSVEVANVQRIEGDPLIPHKSLGRLTFASVVFNRSPLRGDLGFSTRFSTPNGTLFGSAAELCSKSLATG